MKNFIVDTGDKKYKVEANTYDEAISAVKAVQAKKAIKDAYVYRIKNSKGEYEAIKTLTRIEIGTIIEWKNDKWTVTNFLRNDAITDEASPLQTVNALLEDERAAVDAYNVALENLKGKIPDESYAAIEAIRNDENRHIENLQAVVNGNVTEKNLEDSMKDDIDDYQQYIQAATRGLDALKAKRFDEAQHKFELLAKWLKEDLNQR